MVQLKDLRPGDTIYGTYCDDGDASFRDSWECIVKKVKTKGFITVLSLENRNMKMRAVGYYTGFCAVGKEHIFVTSNHGLKTVYKYKKDSEQYKKLKDARDEMYYFLLKK